ncbi:MAG: EpsG family protein [Paramuribaculum sp.]|nr:EpsG family protein [Paramuribaculum sp.]
MTPYYCIFSILALASLSEVINVNKKGRIVILFLLFIALVIFAGCRYQIGAQDFEEYTKSYADVVKNGINYGKYTTSASLFEPGFICLYYLCSLFSSSPVWAMLIVALVAVGINVSCYKEYSPKFFLFATLFYFIHTYILRDMSLIRSGIAAAIVLYSLRYVGQRKLKWFLLTIIIAMSFHLASIIFIIVYPFYAMNLSKRSMIRMVIVSLLISYVFSAGMLLNALPKVGIFSRVSNYSWMIGSSKLGVLTNPTVLKQLFFVVISLVYYDRIKEHCPNFRLLLVPYLLSVCWLMVWNDFAIVAARMATFLSVTEVIIIPTTLILFKKHSRQIAGTVLIALAFIILYWNGNYYLTDVPGLLPYRFTPLETLI